MNLGSAMAVPFSPTEGAPVVARYLRTTQGEDGDAPQPGARFQIPSQLQCPEPLPSRGRRGAKEQAFANESQCVLISSLPVMWVMRLRGNPAPGAAWLAVLPVVDCWLPDVVKVFGMALSFGYVVKRPDCILNVSLSRRLINIVLFQVVPFVARRPGNKKSCACVSVHSLWEALPA